MSIPLIRNALKKVKGVESADIDLTEKRAKVTFDDSLTNEIELEDALSKAGFKANEKDADIMDMNLYRTAAGQND